MIRLAIQASRGSRPGSQLSFNVEDFVRGPIAPTQLRNIRAGGQKSRAKSSKPDKSESEETSSPSDKDVEKASGEFLAAIGTTAPLVRRTFGGVTTTTPPGPRPPRPRPPRRRRSKVSWRRPESRPELHTEAGKTAPNRSPALEELVGKALDLLQIMAKIREAQISKIRLPPGLQGDHASTTPPNNNKDLIMDRRLSSGNTTEGGKAAVSKKKDKELAKEQAKSFPKQEAERTLAEAEEVKEQQTEGDATVREKLEQARPSTEAATSKKKTKTKTKNKNKDKEANKSTIEVKTVRPRQLSLQAIDKPMRPVPRLQYGLERALFNPGVYHLQDPRSRVWNFDPYLATIMPITEFDFDALRKFTRPSKDEELLSLARETGSKYTGSTSSSTQLLSHFHFLLSGWRPLDLKPLSRSFVPESSQFSLINRAPAATFLNYMDGVYAMDADKEFDTASILSMLGQSMEKLLTVPKEDYEKYRKSRSLELSEQERLDPASFHYTTFGDFLMRSQLDAHDPRMPGAGMFDLKTRAVVSIRMNVTNPESGHDYQIRSRFGQFESYEREYYDLMRTAFLKYSLQARMGRMDGIFVAYHNTKRIFGFQYISLAEMDLALHGTENPRLGDEEFKLSLHLLNEALDRLTAKFPNQTLRLHIETRPSNVAPFMYIFGKPVTEKQVDMIQNANDAQVKEMENRIRNAVTKAELEQGADGVFGEVGAGDKQASADGGHIGGGHEQSSLEVWEDIMESVEEALENEQQGKTFIRDTMALALEESGLLQDMTSEESSGYLDALLEQLLLGERDAADAEAAPVVEAGEAESAEKEEQGKEQGEEQGGEPEPASQADAVVQEASEEAAEEAAEQLEQSDCSETAPEPTLEAVQEASSETSTVEASPVESDTNKSRALKDLMHRLVKASFKGPQATKAEPEAKGTEDVAEDTAKLRRFEVILAEMVQNAPSNSAPSGEDDVVLDLSRDKSSKTAKSAKHAELSNGPVHGMLLTIRNKVNGEYVTRPEKLKDSAEWTVEYTFTDIPSDKAQDLYRAVVHRRNQGLNVRTNSSLHEYRSSLQNLSRDGRQWREKEDSIEQSLPVHIVGQDLPRQWTEVFRQKRSAREGSEPDV